jgi:hypothetical protein
MKEIWGEQVVTDNVVDNWHIKLNRVKKFLKGWGLNLKGQTRRYKLMLQKELDVLEQKEEEGVLFPGLLDRRTFIQTELMMLLEEEELYWHKRSNTDWLLKGDNNTNVKNRVTTNQNRGQMRRWERETILTSHGAADLDDQAPGDRTKWRRRWRARCGRLRRGATELSL